MSDEFDVVEQDESGEYVAVDDVFPNEQVKEQLVSYLKREYEEIREGPERAGLLDEWEEWRRISVAKPKEQVKNTPWEGAANVVTPFTFSNVNGVYSHLKSAIAEKRPRWQVKAGNKEQSEAAAAWQRWLNELMLSKLHIDIAAKDDVIMFDGARMGTQFAEVPWTTHRVQFKRHGNDGSTELVDKVTYDGPVIEPVRLEDVIIRSHWDVQTAPYVGIVKPFTRQELRQAEYNGFFEDVERVFASPASQEKSRVAEASDLGTSASAYEDVAEEGTPFEVTKWYVRWDADEDGIAEDLIVWMAMDSGVVLRAEWNELGLRPVGVGKYIGVPGTVYALGVCAMLYRLQEEIDTMHNIGINSLHVSSLQMFATPRGSGMADNEKFFPLKNIKVDDPTRDFQVIRFPNVSRETIEREQVAQQYGRTVTGISEAQLGMPDTTAKSGTSPSLQQFLAQQGNKILRSVIASFAEFYGELGQYVTLQLVANSDRVLAGNAPLLEMADEEDRHLIMQVLMMDVEDIPQLFHLSVKTTDADKTDDARRQMLTMKHQLMMQYMQQGMQIVQMLDNPQVQQMPTVLEFVSRMYVSMTKLMEETLDLFDVEKTEDYLPNYEQQEVMLEIIEMMRQPQIAAAKQQLEAQREGQGVGGQATGLGDWQPGYTAGEGAAGEPGGPGSDGMAPPSGGGGYGGAPAQQPGPGAPGPGQGGGY